MTAWGQPRALGTMAAAEAGVCGCTQVSVSTPSCECTSGLTPPCSGGAAPSLPLSLPSGEQRVAPQSRGGRRWPRLSIVPGDVAGSRWLLGTRCRGPEGQRVAGVTSAVHTASWPCRLPPSGGTALSPPRGHPHGQGPCMHWRGCSWHILGVPALSSRCPCQSLRHPGGVGTSLAPETDA